MVWCRDMFESLEKLEQTAHDNKECEKWLKNLVFPSCPWVRKVFIRVLEENGSDKVPKDLKQDMSNFSECPNTSLPKELLFNFIRRCARGNAKHACGPRTLWHRSLESPVLPECGRPPIEVTSAAQLAAQSRLAASTFVPPKVAESSMDENVCRTLTAAKPTWPSVSSETYTNASVGSLKMHNFKGDWEKMQTSWLSMLARPGQAIRKIGSAHPMALVLRTTPDGMIVWIVKPRQLRHGVKVLEPVFSPGAIQYMTVDSELGKWKCYQVECRPPSDDIFTSPTTLRLVLCIGPVVPLKKAAADAGLRGLTVKQLRNLWQYLKIPGKK